MIMSLITMLTRYGHAYACTYVQTMCSTSLWSFKPKMFFVAGVGKKWGTKELLLEKLFITQHTRCKYVRMDAPIYMQHGVPKLKTY